MQLWQVSQRLRIKVHDFKVYTQLHLLDAEEAYKQVRMVCLRELSDR
jgi:hypothetical protein